MRPFFSKFDLWAPRPTQGDPYAMTVSPLIPTMNEQSPSAQLVAGRPLPAVLGGAPRCTPRRASGGPRLWTRGGALFLALALAPALGLDLWAPVASLLTAPEGRPSVAFLPNAYAQGGNAAGSAQGDGGNKSDPPKVKVERGRGGKKIYRIEEEIRIEGKIQKPEAFYVLQKSSINYEWQSLKQEFLPKIVNSVKKATF